jgi:hypothetical protein
LIEPVKPKTPNLVALNAGYKRAYLYVWPVIGLWVLLSTYTFWHGPEAFSRIGSLGVVGAVLCFAWLSNAKANYVLALQSFERTQVRYYLYASVKHCQIAANVAIIKAASKVPSAAKVAPDLSDMEQSMAKNFDAMDGWLAATDEQHEIWSKRSTSISILEASMAIVSTAQWGYGDLFHCWANGNGWQACY